MARLEDWSPRVSDTSGVCPTICTLTGVFPANSLSALLRRVSGSSTREIDGLIGDLRDLREKLRSDGDRIHREIVEYAALSQQVMQLSKIISESVKRLPDSSGLTP